MAFLRYGASNGPLEMLVLRTPADIYHRQKVGIPCAFEDVA